MIFEDDDAHGVAVIEAARLEALAAPGEILATDLVQRLGQRRVDAGFEEVGSHALKGLDQPVVIVRVVDTGADDAASRPLPEPSRWTGGSRWSDGPTRSSAVLAGWDDGPGRAAPRPSSSPGSRGWASRASSPRSPIGAHADGALVLAGACDSDLAVPYQPFAVGLRRRAGG